MKGKEKKKKKEKAKDSERCVPHTHLSHASRNAESWHTPTSLTQAEMQSRGDSTEGHHEACWRSPRSSRSCVVEEWQRAVGVQESYGHGKRVRVSARVGAVQTTTLYML
jgi:hypothetical protein